MGTELALSGRRKLLLVLWSALFIFALIFYGRSHAPLRFMVRNLTPLAHGLFFLLAFSGPGSVVVLRFFGVRDRGDLFLAGTVLGIGLTGVFVFLLGITGKFHDAWFLLWSAGGFVLFVLCYHRRIAPFPSIRLNPWNVLSIVILAVTLFTLLPFLVAPELSTDALEYHLLLPKIYLQMGRIDYVPLFVQSNYPSLAEYNYLIILSLGGSIACKAFHFWIGIVLLFALARITKTVRPEASALLGPALFLSMPLTGILMGWSWNDLLATLAIVLCLYFLLKYHLAVERRNAADLVMAGIMAGIASWTKYTVLLFLLALFVLLLLSIWRWKWMWKHILFLLFPLVVFAGFWTLKNSWYTGNPVYPFLSRIFPSDLFDPVAFQYLVGTFTRYENPQWDWTRYVLFPIHIALKPRIIDVHTGILPLVLSPLLFIKSKTESERVLKLFLIIYFGIWIFAQTLVRSLLPALAIILCLGAIALQEITGGGSRKFRVAAMAFVALSALSTLLITMVSSHFLFDPVRYFIGRESQAQYRTRLSANQPIYDFLNGAPDVSLVLLVGIHDPFYLQKPYLFSGCCDRPIAQVFSGNTLSPDDVYKKAKQMGISHVAIDEGEYIRENDEKLYSWREEQRSTFQKFILDYCKPVAKSGDKIVLRLVEHR